MEYQDKHGNIINAFHDILADGESCVTIQAEIDDNGNHANPQAMYAVAKSYLKNPRRYSMLKNSAYGYVAGYYVEK